MGFDKSSNDAVEKVSGLITAGTANISDTFRHSTAYLLTTGRKGLAAYEANGAVLLTAVHPHSPETTMIFPEFHGDFTLTARLLASGALPLDNLQCVRFTDNELAALQSKLSTMYSKNLFSFLKTEDDQMDWKYPCRIISTEDIAMLAGSRFDRIRNKFNKASKMVEIMPLESASFISAMRASIHFWIGSLIWQGINDAESYKEFYDALLNNIVKYPQYFDGFIVLKDNEPCGFTIWDKPVNGTANGLASLSRRSIKGMSEFQIVTACQILSDQNVKFYNLGGSEKASLDKHKREYYPTKSVELGSYKVERLPLLISEINRYQII